MDVDSIAKVAGPLLTLVAGALIKHFSVARSKLAWYWGHSSNFTISNPHPLTIHTHSVIVQNSGRKAATQVRLSHVYLPDNVTVFPPIKHEIERNADGSGDICFPELVPKEQVTVSYLYFPPIVWSQVNYSVKSTDGFASQLQVLPTSRPSPALRYLGGVLVFVGASFLFYLLTRAALFVLQSS